MKVFSSPSMLAFDCGDLGLIEGRTSVFFEPGWPSRSATYSSMPDKCLLSMSFPLCMSRCMAGPRLAVDGMKTSLFMMFYASRLRPSGLLSSTRDSRDSSTASSWSMCCTEGLLNMMPCGLYSPGVQNYYEN